MEQKKNKSFYSLISLLCIFSILPVYATTVTLTVTNGGVTYTAMYDNVACLGETTTITYSVLNTNSTPSSACNFSDFVPDCTQGTCPGLINPVVLPPQPSGIESFTTTGGPHCASGGVGQWVLTNPFPNGITYTFTVTVTATQCGLQQFTPCVCGSGAFVVSIVVVPPAQLFDEVVGPVCENSSVTGILPEPICSSSVCLVCYIAGPCCTGYTGACTPYPFYYTVGDATGGSVTLINATGGVYQFTPTNGFYGTGSFEYNVVSDSMPPNFCAAVSSGVIDVIIAQNPQASIASFIGCAGTEVTGNLAPFVTGGSGSYTFSQVGPISCGSITINGNGTFAFTAPTGPDTCTVVYEATDTTSPFCNGTGLASFNVQAGPISQDQTLSTCTGQPVSGTLSATGGTPPYTFSLTDGTGNPVNGTIVLNNPSTGAFTFTPTVPGNAVGSFQFDTTDSNGCMSITPGLVTIDIDAFPAISATAITSCENITVTGNLSSLVTGGTGPITFAPQVTSQTCGLLAIDASGNFQFSPTSGFTGSCMFTYQAAQGGCPATGPGSITFNVAQAPQATGANYSACPDVTVTGNLITLVLPPLPPPPITFTGGPGVNGTLVLSPTGPFTFTPSITAGVASFPFQVLSSLPCPSAVEMVTVTVNPIPTVASGIIGACSGTGTNGNLNPLVSGTPPFSFTGPITEVNGIAVISTHGLFTFTPNVGATGGNFTFGVTDAFGCSNTGIEYIIVNPSPMAMDLTGASCGNSAASGSLVGAVSGGTPPYIFAQVGPAIGGIATVSSAGNYTFKPNPGVMSGSFTFEVTDINGCKAFGMVTITVNLGPIASTGTFTGCGNSIMGDLTTLVTGGTLPYTFTGPIGSVFNGSVMITSAGIFNFMPSVEVGQGSFDYEVTDSSVPPCTSSPTLVTVDIEEGPTALPATFNSCEDQTFTGSLAHFVSGGLPPYHFLQTGPIPACAASIIVAPNGTFSFTPTVGFSGPCSFVYEVIDSTPCDATGLVTMDVHQGPIASDSGPFGACESDGYTGNLNSFVAGGTPPYSFTGDSPVNGTVVISPSGPFTFTPAGVGAASFTYNAIDSFGCESNLGTISFDASESPVETGPSPLVTCQGMPVSSFVVATGSVGIQPFTFSIVSTTNGTAVITSTTATTANFTFTPTMTMAPTGNVIIRATATNGCHDDFTVIINIDQTPIASSTGIGSCSPTLIGNLVNYVTGGTPPYIFSQTGPLSPTGCGTVTISPAGPFIFTSPTVTGTCTFIYQVTDSSLSSCSSTGAITITVSKPPAATGAAFCSCFNTLITGNLSLLVSGGKSPYMYAIVGTPIGGAVFLNPFTGVFTFRPNPGFTGIGSFQFQVTDSNTPPCVSNVATVTIQVPCCPVTGLTGVLRI